MDSFDELNRTKIENLIDSIIEYEYWCDKEPYSELRHWEFSKRDYKVGEESVWMDLVNRWTIRKGTVGGNDFAQTGIDSLLWVLCGRFQGGHDDGKIGFYRTVKSRVEIGIVKASVWESETKQGWRSEVLVETEKEW